MNITYYVYGLLCPLDLSIKYIGCSMQLDERAHNHYYDKSNGKRGQRKREWIQLLKNHNLNFTVIVLNEFNDKDAALKCEREMIKKYKQNILN